MSVFASERPAGPSVFTMEREYITHIRSERGFELTFTTIPSFWPEEPPSLAGLTRRRRDEVRAEMLRAFDLGARQGSTPPQLWATESEQTAILLAHLMSRYVLAEQGAGAPGTAHDVLEFAKEAASAEVVLTEQSPPSGMSLSSLVSAGGAVLSDLSDDPSLLAWGFGALVIVRVADPVLAAVGERLASKIRPKPDGDAGTSPGDVDDDPPGQPS